jgi:hypothetical protein
VALQLVTTMRFPALCLCASVAILSACSGPAPQKGGRATLRTPAATLETIQPENPKEATSQNTATESETVTRIPLRTFSAMMELTNSATAPAAIAVPDEVRSALIALARYTSNGVIEVVNRSKTTHAVNLGSSWRDTARDTAAKLKALGWLPFLGAALVLFGAASAVWPPLKLIVGSVTTSAVCGGVGVALIALPTVIVGHETLLLVLGIAAPLGWWFVHRHATASTKGKLFDLLHAADRTAKPGEAAANVVPFPGK